MGTAIVLYEVLCDDGELLSEAFDRYMERTPWVVRAATGLVALHLVNALPPRYDVLHLVFALKKKPDPGTVFIVVDNRELVSLP